MTEQGYGYTERDLIGALEALVDRTTLTSVVAALADLCREKADHVRANWQDRTTAMQWESAATLLDGASDQISV